MENDSSWIYNQSGVIAFRYEQNDLEILLITSRHRQRWIIPKGIIEHGFSAADSAKNEAFEEAGIEGHVFPNPIGKYQFHKWGGEVTVLVFLFEVTRVIEEWPESSFRKRKWVGVEEAIKLVDLEGLKEIIQNLPLHLDRMKNS